VKCQPRVRQDNYETVIIEKDGDTLNYLCPVMTEAQYNQLCALCDTAANELAAHFAEIIPVVTRIMENHAPIPLKDYCRGIAVKNKNDLAEMVEVLCQSGYLQVPQAQGFYTVYVVV